MSLVNLHHIQTFSAHLILFENPVKIYEKNGLQHLKVKLAEW
jgi:hypothetical protein